MTPTIFTTGAHLVPIKIQKDDGKESWIWSVSEFVDDSFRYGEVFNPKETAESLDILLTE